MWCLSLENRAVWVINWFWARIVFQFYFNAERLLNLEITRITELEWNWYECWAPAWGAGHQDWIGTEIHTPHDLRHEGLWNWNWVYIVNPEHEPIAANQIHVLMKVLMREEHMNWAWMMWDLEWNWDATSNPPIHFWLGARSRALSRIGRYFGQERLYSWNIVNEW